MKLTKTLYYLGFIISILIIINGYFLDYPLRVIGNSDNYIFYRFTSLNYLITSYALVFFGLAFFVVKYTQTHSMFHSDDERHISRIHIETSKQ